MNPHEAERAAGRTPVLPVVACLPWLALLAWLASVAWFLCDDAFISFRYARNLLEGHGLVFNPGERVEGYTNLLWVLELATLWGAFGLKPEAAAPWLSVACTAGTLAALLWWVGRSPSVPAGSRGLVAWMALGLLCSSATFAVWTSGGGLETRQFTLFVVVAVVCLAVYRNRRCGLAAASLALAAAALTRPEGLLLAACCCAWFVAERAVDSGRWRPAARELAWLITPFVVLVAAHFLFRNAYYGEWLPNTYYAKHVRPWYESGFRYLWAAAAETGLYLMLPLAGLALGAGWRARRNLECSLPLLCVTLHMVYLFRIGGDHFEYRPLDFYWPLLALPGAVGIVELGSAIAERLRGHRPAGRLWPASCAVALFVPVLFYSSALQGVLLFESAALRTRIVEWHVEVNRENARWLMAVPGMPMLVAVSNDLRQQMVQQSVALRFAEHREFARQRLQRWQAYEHMERGAIPGDALTAAGTIGIPFYYLADLRVVDTLGLTDATVARNPVTKLNHQRNMAHDRRPPPGYLAARGVNFRAYPAVSGDLPGLVRGEYVAQVGPDLWMPFDTHNHEWAVARFAGRNLRAPSALFDAAERIVRNGQVVIQNSHYDVYRDGDGLVYVTDDCSDADVERSFFLHVVPADPRHLSARGRRHGFENLDFDFHDRGRRAGTRCVAVRPLPTYGIRRIVTGQFVPGQGRVWGEAIDLDVSRTEPTSFSERPRATRPVQGR